MNCYFEAPELYDTLYSRFISNQEDFQRLLLENIAAKNEKILDLACGTGEVSLFLLKNGFEDITLADESPGMLKVAEKKIAELGFQVNSIITKIEDVELKAEFDAIAIRQAINYVEPKKLVKTFQGLNNALTENGILMFNAPNFKPNSTFPEKSYEIIQGTKHLKIIERNIINGRKLFHEQEATITNGSEIKTIVDKTNFFLYTKKEFEQVLKSAGFEHIKFFGKNLTIFSEQSKTIYCAAKKGEF